jgi:hypothetical protein
MGFRLLIYAPRSSNGKTSTPVRDTVWQVPPACPQGRLTVSSRGNPCKLLPRAVDPGQRVKVTTSFTSPDEIRP